MLFIYKSKTIELNGNRRLINACKKAGLTLYNPRGEYNGYGYTKLPMVVEINSLSEMRKFNKISKEVAEIAEKEKNKPKKSRPNPVESWAKRLAKLTGITLEDALEIAHEKLDAKDLEIKNLYDRQKEFYSSRRERFIDKKSRENPLRRIEDEEHAQNILNAHFRHTNTPYEAYLDEIHYLEEAGEIPKGHAQEIARRMLQEGYQVIDEYRESLLDLIQSNRDN